MKLSEWQQSAELTKWAREMFSTATGRAFLKMLEDSHIRHSQVPHVGNESIDSRELGKIYGYDLAMNNINASMEPGQQPVEMVATFGAEDLVASEKKLRRKLK